MSKNSSRKMQSVISGSYPASDTCGLHWSVPADRVRLKHPQNVVVDLSLGEGGQGRELDAAADSRVQFAENITISPGAGKQIP